MTTLSLCLNRQALPACRPFISDRFVSTLVSTLAHTLVVPRCSPARGIRTRIVCESHDRATCEHSAMHNALLCQANATTNDG